MKIPTLSTHYIRRPISTDRTRSYARRWFYGPGNSWETALRKGYSYFQLYDLRSTYATRLSAGGVADEWVTQMLRQTDSKVFKKYSQMKLQMKREALTKLDRSANERRWGKGFWYGNSGPKTFLGSEDAERTETANHWFWKAGMVGATGLEPVTSCVWIGRVVCEAVSGDGLARRKRPISLKLHAPLILLRLE
jgi:hypothetical protein